MSTRIDRISEEVMKALAEAMRSVKDPRVQNGLDHPRRAYLGNAA